MIADAITTARARRFAGTRRDVTFYGPDYLRLRWNRKGRGLSTPTCGRKTRFSECRAHKSKKKGEEKFEEIIKINRVRPIADYYCSPRHFASRRKLQKFRARCNEARHSSLSPSFSVSLPLFVYVQTFALSWLVCCYSS